MYISIHNIRYKNYINYKKVMPKLKVRKAAKKRYKMIAGKRFIRRKAFKGHILEKKSPKQKRNLSKLIVVNKPDTKAIRIMLIC